MEPTFMTYLDCIKIALEGARYHEEQIFLFALEDNNKWLFHLRAYFWELYSVWDYVLRNANNQNKNLKIKFFKVNHQFFDRIEKDNPKYKYIEPLKEFRDNNKMKTIRLLRNSAHEWQFGDIQVAHIDKIVIGISLINYDKKLGGKKVEDLPIQILINKNDLVGFMGDTIKSLYDKDFFN